MNDKSRVPVATRKREALFNLFNNLWMLDNRVFDFSSQTSSLFQITSAFSQEK
jgi:hypothetical protein